MERDMLFREVSYLNSEHESPIIDGGLWALKTFLPNTKPAIETGRALWNMHNLKFPIASIPLNLIGNFYQEYRFDAKRGTTMATFRASRDNGNRLHAARDIYTQPFEPVMSMFAGEVLDVDKFYLDTFQVTIKHDFSLDGKNKIIIRYGELDRKSIPKNIFVGQTVNAGDFLGKTGKLLENNKPAMKSYEKKGVEIFMLHLEAYTGELGYNLKKNPLTVKYQGQGTFQRRMDLVDPIQLLLTSFKKNFRFETHEYASVKKDFNDTTNFLKQLIPFGNSGSKNTKGQYTNRNVSKTAFQRIMNETELINAFNNANLITGVPVGHLMVFAYIESRGNKNIGTNKFGYTGLMQMGRNAVNDILNNFKDAATNGISWDNVVSNPSANVLAGAYYMKLNLKLFGSEIPKDILHTYLAHQQGVDGLKKLLKALKSNPNSPAQKAHLDNLDEKFINSKGGSAQITIQDFFNYWSDKVTSITEGFRKIGYVF
jgi:hypothetical protein